MNFLVLPLSFLLEAVSRSRSSEEQPKQSPAALLSRENKVEEGRAAGIFRENMEKKELHKGKTQDICSEVSISPFLLIDVTLCMHR